MKIFSFFKRWKGKEDVNIWKQKNVQELMNAPVLRACFAMTGQTTLSWPPPSGRFAKRVRVLEDYVLGWF